PRGDGALVGRAALAHGVRRRTRAPAPPAERRRLGRARPGADPRCASPVGARGRSGQRPGPALGRHAGAARQGAGIRAFFGHRQRGRGVPDAVCVAVPTSRGRRFASVEVCALAILPPSVDYTDKDFDALRARLIALVRSVFPDWSDFSVATFGNVLLEMYAFVGDVVTFYLDAQARESRLVTATQRKNVIALARMLGYRLHGARAATAEVVFNLARVPTAAVVIPVGTVVRTQEVTEPVRFQLLADVLIPAGADPPTAVGVVENSQTHSQLFDARGLAGLDIILDRTPYLDGSAVVSAANGAYVEEESLLGSGPNDRHFLVLVDQNDRATVRFGNGTSGAPPSGTISASYKTGGGAGGNVEAGSLVVIEGVFNDAHGRPVQVSVTNVEPASRGSDRQS